MKHFVTQASNIENVLVQHFINADYIDVGMKPANCNHPVSALWTPSVKNGKNRLIIGSINNLYLLSKPKLCQMKIQKDYKLTEKINKSYLLSKPEEWRFMPMENSKGL